MSYSYIFHELAQEDYEISVTWYAERSKLAAQGFIKAINDALLLICAHPSGCRNTYKNFYEITVKKYPFTIIYNIAKTENLIIITSIYHHKKNPKLKFTR